MSTVETQIGSKSLKQNRFKKSDLRNGFEVLLGYRWERPTVDCSRESWRVKREF